MLKTTFFGLRDLFHAYTKGIKIPDSWDTLKILQHMRGQLGRHHVNVKGFSNHFLNHNFGWVPFVNDLRKFIDNSVNWKKKLDHLRRDNGQWVKRKVILVNNTEERDLGWGERTFVRPASDPELRGCFIPTWNPYYNITETVSTVAYGIGRFRYYQPYFDTSIPDGVGPLATIRGLLALHGARITPVNVYKSTPWTWLVDWIAPVGDDLTAFQDQYLDNMAAKYLYLTHHQVKHQHLRQFLPFDDANGGIKELVYSRIIDCKQRKEAVSPYSFSLTWDQLSPKQLMILAALGISRK
jgi:hypothetical protein